MRPTAQAAVLVLCGAVLFTGMIAGGCGRGAQNETVASSHETSVPNGGFEEGTAMWSVGYGFATDDLATDDFSLSADRTYKFTATTDSHSGKNAALLSVRGHLLCLATTNAPDFVPIDRTGTYTLSAFLKIEGKTGSVSSVYMGVRKGSNGDFPETRVGEKTIPPGKDGYREYLLEDLDLTANDRVIIEIGIQNDAEGESRLYIDDVRLYVPQAATGTLETSTTTAAPTTSVSDPPTPAGTPPTTAEKLSSAEILLPNGHIQAMGYIDRVWEDGGTRHLSIDFAEFLTGEPAVKAAVEDGRIRPGEILDNDYYIRNRNPPKRVFDISSRAAFIIDPGGGAPHVVTWHEFESYWAAPEDDPQSLHGVPWRIERAGSQVVKVEQIYVP